ncbi:MAG: uracil-DNA glycosylase [Bacteroidales bacterium]|jgi:uracil-DNA glycosylase|nr:uracil-DNA glycosylase [Bacteroidales bacterium]
MDVKIETGWREKLREEFEKEYFIALTDFVREEYRTRQVFPPGNRIFNAFDLCPFDRVKVVIIGQDPYHNIGQAHGLCFSVTDGTDYPPSLVNIFKELNRDLGVPVPASGNLERWARQGVLLLNAILTVRAHQALSHQNKGWERFTDAAISILNSDRDNIVFMLWGAYAQNKGVSIDPSRHLVLKTVHPSPLSAHRGFFGCSHFSKCNEWLRSRGLEPIEW